MEYPDGYDWGAVYFVARNLEDLSRDYRDVSSYRELTFDARELTAGATVEVGIKDLDDPDDGSEDRSSIKELTDTWRTYEFKLEEFNLCRF